LTIAATCGMKKVSIVFTTNTSDSGFPSVCPGFGPINLARQSQELKLNPYDNLKAWMLQEKEIGIEGCGSTS